jgi:hypothetical protein
MSLASPLYSFSMTTVRCRLAGDTQTLGCRPAAAAAAASNMTLSRSAA